jgi:hypothetical protein
MLTWLLIAAAAQAASAANAGIGMKGLAPVDVGPVAVARALDFRLSQEIRSSSPVPLIRGLIVSRGVAPNATVGLGLANLYERRKPGFDARDDGRPRRSRKPAVTFVLKF